jgi:hypothetical protein
VAVINSNDDTVEMLRIMLESAGLLTVSAHVSDIRRGVFDFGGFMEEHDPQVVIFDLVPPYDRCWLMLKHLRATPAGASRRWVLTSTNPPRVREVAGADEPILEIIGKPYDLQAIVEAVKSKLGA